MSVADSVRQRSKDRWNSLKENPEPVVKTVAPATGFPLDEVLKFTGRVRQAHTKERIPIIVSLRDQLTWARLYRLFLDAQIPSGFSAAFHCAILERHHGEARTFLEKLFFTSFGIHAEPPAGLESNVHPLEAVIGLVVEQGMPLWLHGPTGAGKSWCTRHVAQFLERPYIRFQGSREVSIDHLVGSMGLVAGQTVFQEGPLPTAMRTGAVFNLDEPTLCSPDILAEIHGVLDGQPLHLKGNGGEIVTPAKGFSVVLTDNTRGMGEGLEYVGTSCISEALRNRFVFLEFSYPPLAMERRILMEALG